MSPATLDSTGTVSVASVRKWVIVCPVCQIVVDGYRDPAEAGYLAGVHNDLHHGSRPDATVSEVEEPANEAVAGRLDGAA